MKKPKDEPAQLLRRPALPRDQRSELVGPSEAQLQRMLQAISSGMKRTQAYRLAGIATTTFYDWMAKGKDPSHEPYASFRRALLVAEAAIVEQMTDMVMTHAVEDWKAAAWWLERVHHKAFGKRAALQAVVKQEATVSADEQERLLASMEAALKSRVTK